MEAAKLAGIGHRASGASRGVYLDHETTSRLTGQSLAVHRPSVPQYSTRSATSVFGDVRDLLGAESALLGSAWCAARDDMACIVQNRFHHSFDSDALI